jgi:hypothetical protein
VGHPGGGVTLCCTAEHAIIAQIRMAMSAPPASIVLGAADVASALPLDTGIPSLPFSLPPT